MTEEEFDRQLRHLAKGRGDYVFFAVALVATFGGGTAFSVFLWWFGL